MIVCGCLLLATSALGISRRLALAVKMDGADFLQDSVAAQAVRLDMSIYFPFDTMDGLQEM
jgi:hypothetical protein